MDISRWKTSTTAHCWIMSSPLIHTQSLEIDYSVTIRAIVMKLPDNKNESPKNALKQKIQCQYLSQIWENAIFWRAGYLRLIFGTQIDVPNIRKSCQNNFFRWAAQIWKTLDWSFCWGKYQCETYIKISASSVFLGNLSKIWIKFNKFMWNKNIFKWTVFFTGIQYCALLGGVFRPPQFTDLNFPPSPLCLCNMIEGFFHQVLPCLTWKNSSTWWDFPTHL